jgi:cation diffusion facilitator family transporter
MAEALHSLGDLLSDLVTLYAYKFARAKADSKYPYGYGKIEPLGGLIVSGLLAGGGLGMAIHSLDQLHFMIFSGVDQAHQVLSADNPFFSHDYSSMIALSPYAAGILVASIGIKEWLYRITLKVGKRTQSSVLIANAYHHRSDVITSIVALAGVGGTAVGLPLLDPIGGMVVSGMVIKMGIESGIPSLKELMDIAVPDSTLVHVKQALSEMEVITHL